MIPQILQTEWKKAQARAELLFLADHGGGCPECLRGDLTPEERLGILRDLDF